MIRWVRWGGRQAGRGRRLSGLMALLIAGSACGLPGAGTPQVHAAPAEESRPDRPETRLRVLTWPGYLAPGLIARFQERTGIRVEEVPLRSYDDLRRQLATQKENPTDPSGPPAPDLAIPADHMIATLIEDRLLQRIPARDLPGYDALPEAWRRRPIDPTGEFALPFQWATISFVVDNAAFAGDVDTLSILFAPPRPLVERLSLLDTEEATIRLALLYLGLPSCSAKPADLAAAAQVIAGITENATITTADRLVTTLAEDDVALGVTWNGHALRARLHKPTLRYAWPREGLIVWSDYLVIPHNAPNPSAARAFLSHILEPANAALQTAHTGYATAVPAPEQFIDSRIAGAPELRDPGRLDLRTVCDAETLTRHKEAWNALWPTGTGNRTTAAQAPSTRHDGSSEETMWRRRSDHASPITIR